MSDNLPPRPSFQNRPVFNQQPPTGAPVVRPPQQPNSAAPQQPQQGQPFAPPQRERINLPGISPQPQVAPVQQPMVQQPPQRQPVPQQPQPQVNQPRPPQAYPQPGQMPPQGPNMPPQGYPAQQYPQQRPMPQGAQPGGPIPPHLINQQPRPKGGKGKLVAIILLSIFGLVMIAVAGGTAINAASMNNKLNQIQQENQDLRDSLDSKNAFVEVYDIYEAELAYFNGMPYKEYIDQQSADLTYLNDSAYEYRDTPDIVDTYTEELESYLEELRTVKTTFETNKTTNSTGGSEEGVLDDISKGYVETYYYRYANDTNCGGMTASGCVQFASPDKVNLNLDEKDNAIRWLGGSGGQWWFNGVVYHEYAHILQGTNPEATSAVIEIFNNDYELMADCYTVIYYDPSFISYSYNKGCNSTQQQAIKDWMAAITYTAPTPV